MRYYIGRIIGVLLIVAQIVFFISNGIPAFSGDSYSAGYIVGSCAPGIIGVIIVIMSFKNKPKK